jgi:aldehyde dehydrogenase family protein
VPEGSAAVTEETFGPTVTVTPVAGLGEAVSLANAGRYGLGSAVFARDRSAAMTAARSLRSGMTSINSVLGFAIVPALPFGGVGESGFGRIHGADGLREFTRPKAITRQRMRPLIALTTFGRTDRDMRRIVTLVTLLHGRLYRPRGGGRRARLGYWRLGAGVAVVAVGLAGEDHGVDGVGGVHRGQRGPAGDEVGGPLGDRDRGRVGVPARHDRHH